MTGRRRPTPTAIDSGSRISAGDVASPADEGLKVLLTPEEAARSLSIGRTQVYALLRTDQLESVTIGSSRRVPVAAVRRFVARLDGSGPVVDRDDSAAVTPMRHHRGHSTRRAARRQQQALPFDEQFVPIGPPSTRRGR